MNCLNATGTNYHLESAHIQLQIRHNAIAHLHAMFHQPSGLLLKPTPRHRQHTEKKLKKGGQRQPNQGTYKYKTIS